jgi:hypothetical protein
MGPIKMSKGLLGATVALVLTQALSGCGAGGDAGADTAGSEAVQTESSAVEGISGELLASVQLSDKHAVQFYDFGEGLLGARESMPMGTDSVLDGFENELPLAEIFSLLKPNVAVPAALIAAQVRADQYNREHPSVGPRADRTLAQEEAGRAVELSAPTSVSARVGAAEQVGYGEQVGSVKQAATTCSDDLFGDQWGAQWFLNNFCNEGCFRYCHTNQAWRTVSTGGHEKGGRIDSQCGHGHAAGLTCN